MIGITLAALSLKRNVLTYAAVLLVAHDTLGILYGHLSHGLQYGNRGHEDEVENDYLDNQHHHASDGLGPTHVELHQKRLGQAGDDTHHDDERNTVTKTLVRNLLTEPHDEHGAGGKYHYRADLEQEVVGPEDECLAREPCGKDWRYRPNLATGAR